MKKKALIGFTIFLACLTLIISEYISQKHNHQNSNMTEKISSQKIKSLIDNLDINNKYIDVNGEKVVISYQAYRDLRDMGEPVMPLLIEELNNNRSIRVRTYLFAIGYYINSKNNTKLLEYLPVLVKHMKDKEPEIRQSTVSILGDIAIKFKYKGNPEYFEKAVPYLVEALKDQDRYIQFIAGKDLYDCGRRDLVPDDLFEEFQMDKLFIDRMD
jgi:hypothetical protein